MKLHVGCGEKIFPGWTNLDIDKQTTYIIIKKFGYETSCWLWGKNFSRMD